MSTPSTLSDPPVPDAPPPEPSPVDASVKAKKRKKDKKDKKKKGDRLGSARGIETMFRTSYMTHVELSAIADNKAGILISINGLIISIIMAALAPRIDNAGEGWIVWPVSVLLLASVGSIVYAILAARPRYRTSAVSADDVRGGRANILFFGNFVHVPEDIFLEGMTALMRDPDRLYATMTRDLYGLGSVLARKYALLRRAYTVFMVGLVVSVVLFVGLAVSVGR